MFSTFAVTQWSNLFHKIVCLTMYHQARFKSKRISSWEDITDTVIFICDVYHQKKFKSKRISSWEDITETFIVQELCEGQGGRPGLSVLTSLLVSADVKIYWTVLRHWSQLVSHMSTDIWGHYATIHPIETVIFICDVYHQTRFNNNNGNL